MTEHQQGSSSRSEMSIASAKVAAIVDAAERAAAELREHTEADVAATLAEAERERDRTVRAVQDEARGIVEAARREGEVVKAEAVADAQRMRVEAAAEAREIHRVAEAEAREIVTGAYASARTVLRDGTALSEQLEQLSGSLRRNAERLLKDVQLAHDTMTAELESAAPGGKPLVPPGRCREDVPAESELAARHSDDGFGSAAEDHGATIKTGFDIPEFLPHDVFLVRGGRDRRLLRRRQLLLPGADRRSRRHERAASASRPGKE